MELYLALVRRSVEYRPTYIHLRLTSHLPIWYIDAL